MTTYNDILYAICGTGNPNPIGFGTTQLTPELKEYFDVDVFSAGISWLVEKERDTALSLIYELSAKFSSGDYGLYDNTEELEDTDPFNNLLLLGKYPTQFGTIYIEERHLNDSVKKTIYFDFEQ